MHETGKSSNCIYLVFSRYFAFCLSAQDFEFLLAVSACQQCKQLKGTFLSKVYFVSVILYSTIAAVLPFLFRVYCFMRTLARFVFSLDFFIFFFFIR